MIGAFNANVPGGKRGGGGKPRIRLLDGAAELSGTGRIGTMLEVTVPLAASAPAETVLAYEWCADGAPIDEARAAQLDIVEALDLRSVTCRVTASAEGRVEHTETAAVMVRYEAPTGLEVAPDEILDAGTGDQVIDTSVYFTGDGLGYSVQGGPVPIDAETGHLTIATNGSWRGGELIVTASNSGGSWQTGLMVVLEEQPQADQVLDFRAPDTALTLDGHGLPGAIGPEGVWLSTFYYFNGTDGANKCLLGLADPGSGAKYLQVQPQRLQLRNGGGDLTFDALPATVQPGWYLVTAHLWEDGAGRVQGRLFRNGEVSGAYDFRIALDLSAFPRLGWSMLPDSTPRFGGYRQAGLSWGTGNPAAYHAAVHNGGSFADPAGYDFAADAAAERLGFEAGAQLGTGAGFAPEDLAHGWRVVGKPVWADAAPPHAAADFAAVSALKAPRAAAPRQVEVELDLGLTDWRDPVIDPERISVVAEFGYGALQVAGAAIATAGPIGTVTLTLDRDLYADEILRLAFRAGWVTDAAGNIAVAGTYEGIASQTGLARPAEVTGLSRNGISFEFARPYEAGHTADGVMWVRDPGTGVEIAAKTPALGEIGGRPTHGTMLNPARSSIGAQGYCASGSEAKGYYDPALSVRFPQTLAPGDSLIGVLGNPAPYDLHGGRSGNPVNILAYQGLIVTDFTPAPEDMPPPLLGHDAATRPPWLRVDIDAIVAGLPAGYETTGHDRPPAGIAIRRIERFNPAQTQFGKVEMKREMTPAGVTNQDGYGVNFAGTMSAVLLTLLAAETTPEERRRLVRAIVHHYRQWYGTGKLTADGGHNQGMWAPMVLGDAWVNGGAGIATLFDVIGGNERTAFRVEDEAMRARMTEPHDGAEDHPDYNARTTVTAVADRQVNLATVDRRSRSALRDAARARDNLVLVRESDGAMAQIVDADDTSGVFTLATAIPGLAVGDVVYAVPPWPVAVGEYEWSLRPGLTLYSPSKRTSYRQLNQWSAQVLAVRALGLMHPAFAAIEGYVTRANLGSNPTGANDFPPHHSTIVLGPEDQASGNIRWDRHFWAQHWPTIKNIPQKY